MKTSRYGRFIALFALVGFLGTAAIGCGETVIDEGPDSPSGPSTKASELNDQVYVDLETFEQYRADGATVLDLRGAEDYAKGHVPGAVQSSWKDFADDDREGAFIETEVDKLQTAARELGIDNDRKVLIYGSKVSTLQSRQAWSLEYIGHTDVYILNGSYGTWKAEAGVDPSTDTPDVEPGSFEVSLTHDILATGDDVQKAAEGEVTGILFDARSEAEFKGTDERDNPRHGHVPNAIHYNWKNVFNSDGTLRPKDEIRQELDAKGLLAADAVIIPYCQGGFRSAVVYSVLRWLGRDDVKNYDGSWFEYSRNTEWEVETP